VRRKSEQGPENFPRTLSLFSQFNNFVDLADEIEPAENFKCTFDASTCDNTCDELLGYETNPLGCQTSCKCKVSSFIEEDIKFTKDDLLTIRKVRV